MKQKISVIIPCYNEEERLPQTLKKIGEYIKKDPRFDFEVIVVDDGSKDSTVQIAKEHEKKEGNLRVLVNKKNSGKGYSVKRGMLESSGDYALFMDADSSTEIGELEEFKKYLERYDILIGSRHIEKNSIVLKQNLIRRIAGFFAHKLIHLFIISDIKDTMCGFKLFNKKAKEIFRMQRNYRWGFDYEILYLARKKNLRIKEIPVHWKDDRKSKVTLKGYLYSIVELFKIRINGLAGRYR